jgi:hypothetical protein
MNSRNLREVREPGALCATGQVRKSVVLVE